MTKTINEDGDVYLTSPLYVIRLLLPLETKQEAIEIVLNTISDMALSASYFTKEYNGNELLTIEWLIDFTPDMAEMRTLIDAGIVNAEISNISLNDNNLALEKVIQTDWLEECYQQFEPFKVDGFFIYGSNYDKEIPDGLIGLQINAATAFGSGEHGTTKGCLMALEKLVASGFAPNNILDMGTGSGILAIAAYKRFNVPTLAVDNDRESVRVCGEHRDLNNVPSSELISVYGNGYDCDEVRQLSIFDLIYANILAGPLKEMAPDLSKYLSSNGYAILSGMLEDQANEVLEAHKNQGLELVDRIDIDGWSSLTLNKV